MGQQHDMEFVLDSELSKIVKNHRRRLETTLLIMRNPLPAHQLTDRLHFSPGNSRI